MLLVFPASPSCFLLTSRNSCPESKEIRPGLTERSALLHSRRGLCVCSEARDLLVPTRHVTWIFHVRRARVQKCVTGFTTLRHCVKFSQLQPPTPHLIKRGARTKDVPETIGVRCTRITGDLKACCTSSQEYFVHFQRQEEIKCGAHFTLRVLYSPSRPVRDRVKYIFTSAVRGL